VLGALSCFALFAVAFKDNWLWMSGWIVAGLLVYFLYGYKRSKLRAQKR
jgi:APA family basic amino acid/polyamine antiporter